MAKREVTQIYRDRDGNISAFFVRDWGKIPKEEVIQDIRNCKHYYYVKDPLEHFLNEAKVTVVCEEDGKYLRTTADESILNNLDSLPDY